MDDSDQNSIIISSKSGKFCKDCNIIISIIAQKDSEYMITANNEQYLEILQNGIPAHGIVQKNKIDSYMFTLDVPKSIEIRLINYSGDADIYVDTNTPVSKDFNK